MAEHRNHTGSRRRRSRKPKPINKPLLVCGLLFALCWLGVLMWFVTRSEAEVPQEVVSALEAEAERKAQATETPTPTEAVSALATATQEQREAIYNGTTTAEEIKDELGITQALEQLANSETQTADSGTQAVDSSAQSEEQKTQEEILVDGCVAELSSLQVDLMAQLAVMKQEVLDEWNSLSEEEKTTTRKKELAFEGLDRCYELESVVDAEVQEILDRYEEQLISIGGDISVLDELWDYYVQEKNSQEAYYTSYLN